MILEKLKELVQEAITSHAKAEQKKAAAHNIMQSQPVTMEMQQYESILLQESKACHQKTGYLLEQIQIILNKAQED